MRYLESLKVVEMDEESSVSRANGRYEARSFPENSHARTLWQQRPRRQSERGSYLKDNAC